MAITPELMLPSSFQHYLLGLFAVANNFPAIGPFLTLSQGVPAVQVRRVIRITTFSSLLIMLGAYVLGTAVLKFFGISVSAFQIAGGLLLGFSGLSMLNASDPGDSHEKNFDVSHMDVGQMTSSAIVPISLPLTTGAGTMSTITVYASSAHSLSNHIALFAAILAMTTLIGLMFTFATRLTQMLGHVGMTVLIKVMGLFTLAIGVQFIATGASTILGQITLRV
ncbi:MULTISPECIES: MarC family protein [unclassified Cyanobium]|uniref:MarC family protein n=1 Tax=unclassified Cyanobium TaxID=2627006 RepID=UPI0020CDDC0C|nr:MULTISPECIES: MarC family protein [unclassified Cyanobium]MCP9832733.1 NAAT family transporter [Cyanobium sp. La Preciosa 7G6]MCP9935484.1 NAAT family transporter [Cyanobium sp. Aljojuca 7A6]